MGNKSNSVGSHASLQSAGDPGANNINSATSAGSYQGNSGASYPGSRDEQSSVGSGPASSSSSSGPGRYQPVRATSLLDKMMSMLLGVNRLIEPVLHLTGHAKDQLKMRNFCRKSFPSYVAGLVLHQKSQSLKLNSPQRPNYRVEIPAEKLKICNSF